jgi:hypothetical protein
MKCTVSSYSYPALLPEQDSIRLLRLLPQNDNDVQIQCELINIRLGDLLGQSHPYEALSYTWGDPEETQIISINGFNVLVTRQLHEALSRLQYRYFERIIWIDAICIDQGNREEKGQQIRLMPKIYSQAKSVIVWLGEAANNSDQALETIVLAGRDRTTGFTNEAAVQQAVMVLLKRDWFRRIWVIELLVRFSKAEC